MLDFKVTQRDGNMWTISIGDRYISHLGTDEVMYVIARLLIGGIESADGCYGGFRTLEQHKARFISSYPNLAANESDLLKSIEP